LTGEGERERVVERGVCTNEPFREGAADFGLQLRRERRVAEVEKSTVGLLKLNS
jgi:hypothetical protein